jgi:CO/xanthine dehydrogenase FAD-binding subunit
MRDQSGRIPKFPQNIISLAKLDELRKISRTERYLEIGAMVKLNQIIDLGKIVPDVLAYCLKNIADPQVRNLAAIGGNICIPSRRYDVSAPMIALDAQFELRTAQSTRWISASRFLSLPGPPALAAQEILTRIRVPLEPWSFSWYRKFRASGGNEPGGGILIIMRNQKNILTDIRVVYSGKTILREKNSETMLEGQRLPLDRKNAEAFVNAWRTYLSVFEGNEEYIFPGEAENLNPELIKAQIVNFIESILMNLSD